MGSQPTRADQFDAARGTASRVSDLLAVAIIVLGILLRWHQIDYNFNGDELFSVTAASGSFRHVLDASIMDRPHPPLHLLLLWAWLKAVGASETGARTLSIVASLGFLVTAWRLLRRLMNSLGVLFTLFVLAVSPFFVYYGEEARPYALIACFAALTAYFLFRAEEERARWRWRLLYGASCMALVYSQYLGVFIILPQLAAIAMSRAGDRRWLLPIGCIGIAAIVPWLATVAVVNPSGLQSAAPAWIGRPGVTGLAEYYLEIFGWLPLQGTRRILLLLTCAALGGIVLRWREVINWRIVLVMGTAVFLPAVVFFVSQYGPASIWAPRQLIGAAMFAACAVGLGVMRLPGPIGWVVAAGFGAWVALALPGGLPVHANPPWRSIASSLNAEVPDRPVFGTEADIVLPLAHYLSRDVQYVPEPTNLGPGEFVLVCRLSKCAELSELKTQFEPVELRTVVWTVRPDFDSIIKIYLLRRGKSSEARHKDATTMIPPPWELRTFPLPLSMIHWISASQSGPRKWA